MSALAVLSDLASVTISAIQLQELFFQITSRANSVTSDRFAVHQQVLQICLEMHQAVFSRNYGEPCLAAPHTLARLSAGHISEENCNQVCTVTASTPSVGNTVADHKAEKGVCIGRVMYRSMPGALSSTWQDCLRVALGHIIGNCVQA